MTAIEIHRPGDSSKFTREAFRKLLADPSMGQWVMDTETNGLEVIGDEAPHYAHWIGLMPLGTRHVFVVTRDEFDEWELRGLVEELPLVGHNLRFDLHALDLQPKKPWVDTMVAAYWRHTTGKLSMDHIAKVKGWPKIPTPDALKQGNIAGMPEEELVKYLADDCLITAKMAKTLQVDQAEKDYLVEKAVYAMERRGMLLLDDKLSKVGDQLDELLRMSESALRYSGLEGNLNSSSCVSSWLIAKGRRLPHTPSGNPSTSKIVLQKLADDGDELAHQILSWRKLIKLKTSFVEPLPKLTQFGILYPRTSTTRTATGRFACSSPNLQQIPKRGPLGKAIRGCLTSRDQGGVTSCDFSQVELRVAASFAKEPTLLEAFAQGRCPHTEVAAKMLGKHVSTISPEERFNAKAVNFGILNGMGAKRLAIELKTNKAAANKFLSEYRRNLPGLHEWMEQVWQEAETYQLARTVGGRTRIFGNHMPTRPAISVIVQGSAAELMRASLVAAEEAGLKPILSVHDEVLIGGKEGGEKLREVMEYAANNAYPDTFNNVNFPADSQSGDTWGDV